MATNVIMPPSDTEQVCMLPAPEPAHIEPRRKHKLTVYKLGISEIVLGILLVLLGCLPFFYRGYDYWLNNLKSMAPDIWVGFFPIASGSFGVCLRENPSKCRYRANLVLSVFSLCSLLVLIIISVSDATILKGIIEIVQIARTGLGVVLLILCIMHLVYSSSACGSKKATNPVLYRTSPPVQTAPTAQHVQLANGQYMLVQNPVIVGQPYPIAPIHLQIATQSPFQPQYAMQAPVQPQASIQAPTQASSPTLTPQNQPPVKPDQEILPYVELPASETDPILPTYDSLNLEVPNLDQ